VLTIADARREPPLRISGKMRGTSVGVTTHARRSLKDGTPEVTPVRLVRKNRVA
jgi:hypothetical protein